MSKNYDVILWDMDGTLLDFLAAEKNAIRSCFEKFQLGECSDDMLSRYSAINKRYWEMLERQELTKQEVLEGRFREFFSKEGLPVFMAEAFNAEYQIRLGDTVVYRDDSLELVRVLKSEVKQYIVTNGTKIAQDRKLKLSHFGKLMDGVFISDEIGIEKPLTGFFDKVFEQLGDVPRERVLIVGDSLTSDMRGGNNAKIKCCWYNPSGEKRPGDIRIDYDISNLQEIRGILN